MWISDSLFQHTGFRNQIQRIMRHFTDLGHETAQLGWFANDYKNADQCLPLPCHYHYSTLKTHERTGCCKTTGLFIDRMDRQGRLAFFEVNQNTRSIFPSTRLSCAGGRVIPEDKYALNSLSFVVSDFKPEIVFSLGDLWMVEPCTHGSLRNYYSLISYIPVDGDPLPTFTSQTNALIDYGGYDIDWRKTFRGMDRVVAYTEYGKNVINNLMEEELCKDFVWHGCDTDILYPMSPDERRELKRTFFAKESMKFLNNDPPKVLEDDTIITCVSRNQPRKGYPYLFEAAASLMGRYPQKNMYLYIHATPQDCGWNFTDLGKEFNIAHRVIIDKSLRVGSGVKDEDMRLVYNVSTISALATRGEGWGLSFSESMACGIPVVATPYSGHGSPGGWAVGAFEEIPIKARDREPITGINRVIPSIEGLTNAMDHALQPHRHAELVELGLKKAQEFSWKNILPQWEKIIRTTPLRHKRYPEPGEETQKERVFVKSSWASNPLVSVIVTSSVMVSTPQYDRVLKQCITSLDRQTYRPWELILVDNISHGPDMTHYIDRLKHTVVRWPWKFHAPRVLNKAVEYTHGDFLLFLHSDTSLSEETLLKMMNIMSIRPQTGIVGGALVNEKRTKRHVGYGYNILREMAPNTGDGDGVALVEGVNDVCLLVRKKLFLDMGGFDEEYLTTWFDVDLCQRAKVQGHETLIDTSTQVIHVGNLTRRYHQKSSEIMDKRRFYSKFGQDTEAKGVA